MIYDGGCHCGALTVAFESPRPASELPVRECQCSFCRKHGSRATTDSEGSLTVWAHDPDVLLRYRFGLQTADFLICRRCGVYVAAVSRDPAQPHGIAIVNALDDHAAFISAARPTDYSSETRDKRIARRRATWTPAEVVTGAD